MFGITTLLALSAFCVADSLLSATHLQGIYYLIHAIHNGLITHATYHEVVRVFSDFRTLHLAPPNYYAAELVFALHFYHCLYYWRKFRLDDWLHHILMIAVALPIGVYLPSGPFLGFSLFFTTGLPGCIDYALLFLVRNGWLHRDTEKRVNARLATWVRGPGCVAQAAFTCAFNTLHYSPYPYNYLVYLSAALNYWNGAYFGAQVIYDAGQRGIYGPPALPA